MKEEVMSEIEDLLFDLDFKQEVIIKEILKYCVFYFYYQKKINNLIDISNYRYLGAKARNLTFSTNQLIYEAALEYNFNKQLVNILNNKNSKYIFNDICPDIEDAIIVFSNNANNRDDYFSFYDDAFNDFLDNGLILDDQYYMSNVNKDDYIKVLRKINKELDEYSKTK